MVPQLKRDPSNWVVVDAFRPGARPVSELAKALTAVFARYGRNQDWLSVRDMLTGAANKNMSIVCSIWPTSCAW